MGMLFFRKRNKQVEVHRLIRRIIDGSSPNLLLQRENTRWEDRSNRTIPVLLVPMAGTEIRTDEATVAVTKNLSSQGLAQVLPQPVWAEGVIIGLWNDGQAEYVRGEIRQNVPIGGGFWQLGIELFERMLVAETPSLQSLLPMAERLEPQEHLAKTDP
jgi:hypothetical protein